MGSNGKGFVGTGLSLLAGMWIVAGLSAWLEGSVSDTEAARAEYCSMWEIWHADRRAGVPVDKRYGWPDQAGQYYVECE